MKGGRVVSEAEMVKRGGWIGVEMKIIDLMNVRLGGLGTNQMLEKQGSQGTLTRLVLQGNKETGIQGKPGISETRVIPEMFEEETSLLGLFKTNQRETRIDLDENEAITGIERCMVGVYLEMRHPIEAWNAESEAVEATGIVQEKWRGSLVIRPQYQWIAGAEAQ